MIRWSVLLFVAALAATGLSCGVNEYCVNCALDDGGSGRDGGDGDGGTIDGMDDGDGGPPADACVTTGSEQCDGLDNDCDGKVDESTTAEPLPAPVGEDCGGSMGACTPGKRVCVDGAIKCSGVEGSPETCNGKDDDCDGTPDDGDPGGGSTCPGKCGPGVAHCVSGAIACQETRAPSSEICDGIDNDCNGEIDDGLTNLRACGTDRGLCEVGHVDCVGGREVCLGGVGPVNEICDTLDQDCDGSNTNGFDLQNDVRNCGTCNNNCNLAHATPKCQTGRCAIAGCDPDFHDNNRLPADGCEYGCTVRGTVEACNGIDDDCNGTIDIGVVPPTNLCLSAGECGPGPGGRQAVRPACGGALGWSCPYEPDATRDVSVDTTGAIVPETKCDGLDNDCDGRTDESHPQKNGTCTDNGRGACQRTGVLVCNPTDPTGALICQFPAGPGPQPSTETCNGLDDDCDGVVDNGAETGNLGGQEWVSIGGGREIMKYEASRPDATAASQGGTSARVCSKSGVLPWTNVKQPEAETACASIGARLCTEQEWHRACSVVNPQLYPIAEPATNNGRMFIEAEAFFASTPALDPDDNEIRSWVPDYSGAASGTGRLSGISAMRVSPDLGASPVGGGEPNNDASQLAQSPRLDYQINFTTAGSHRVWLRMLSANGNDDDVFVGINTSLTGATAQAQFTASSNNTWVWRRADLNVTGTGNRFLSIWMGDDGAKVDAIVVTRSTSNTVPTELSAAGNTWAYQNTPNASQPTVCNGDAFDTDPSTPGDQDDVIATGARPQCNANWAAAGQIFDLSGNVREWTAERRPGANPIRGGASNATEDGLRCNLSFTLANDTFLFPNVGFRCCR